MKTHYDPRRQESKQKEWESFIKLLNLAIASGVWWGQKSKLTSGGWVLEGEPGNPFSIL